MAKIVYYSNPLDKNDCKHLEIEKGSKLIDVLKKEGIENKPLCIVINDKILDDVDLDYLIEENDDIEILNFVEGNNQTWATIVDIVTVVVAVALIVAVPGAGALAIGAVLATGALISGALRANISQPNIEQSGNNLSSSSPSSASNQARHYQPIPIIMGSIRFAPDLYTEAMITRPLKWYDANVAGNPFYDGIGYSWDLPIYAGYPTPDPFTRRVDIIQPSYLSQSFCFGFGDLSINHRKLGTIPLDENLTNRVTIDFSDYGYNDAFGFSRKNESFGTIYGASNHIPVRADFDFETAVRPLAPTSIKLSKSVQLSNVSDPTGLISTSDQALYNWNFFEGGKGQNVFQFAITGSIYGQSEGNLGPNTTVIELQARMVGETDWTSQYPASYQITGSTSSPIYTFFTYTFPFWKPLTEKDSMQIRIRKRTRDNVDNQTGSTTLVSRLTIQDACFYENEQQNEDYNDFFGKSKFPMVIEAIAVNNTLASSASGANNYNALVEASCYYYDFLNEEWVWGKTRNPAWWFLYFARGGFLSLESKGGMDLENVFPFSPTWYWQNYAGHSKNTELIFGGGYVDDKIDIDKIKDWASFCDENSLRLDLVIKEQMPVSEQLERIASIGRGSVNYDKGKLSVIFEDKNQIPVSSFGMGNIISGSFSSSYISKGNFGKVVASFANRENDFEVEEIEVPIPFADPDNLASSEISLEGVTELQQAQKEANLLAARQFFQSRTYKWKSDHEGFLARRGDLVYLSHDATQFGYSGRVVDFILDDSNNFLGIRPSGLIDKDIEWVMIKLPNNEMKTLPCHIEDGNIVFDDTFLKIDGPSHIRDQKRNQTNPLSRFSNTTADDYTYIADIKSSTGKIVRISAVESDEDNNFEYSAFDEDPALWAFEQGVVIDPESVNDSIGIIEVTDCSVCYLGGGDVELLFNGSDDCLFMFINEANDQPIEINGRFSTSEKRAKLELNENEEVTIKIVPLSINEKVQSRSFRVTLWQA